MKAAVKTVYALALLVIAVAPASADILYSNGPINGTITADLIDFGQSINDSFVLSSASTVTGVDFGAWTNPGDSVTSVQWSIGTTPGGNTYSGTAATIDSFVTIGYGFYAVEKDTFSIPSVSLGVGTYYLTLENAVTAVSGNAFWDVNDGPSSAYIDGLSPINSESFDVQGTTGTVTPEPGYWALLSVAIIGLICLKRLRVRAEP